MDFHMKLNPITRHCWCNSTAGHNPKHLHIIIIVIVKCIIAFINKLRTDDTTLVVWVDVIDNDDDDNNVKDHITVSSELLTITFLQI